MIKSKKGRVVMRGTTQNIIADYMTITKAMIRTFPKEVEEALDAHKAQLEKEFNDFVANLRQEAEADEDETVTDSELA